MEQSHSKQSLYKDHSITTLKVFVSWANIHACNFFPNDVWGLTYIRM